MYIKHLISLSLILLLTLFGGPFSSDIIAQSFNVEKTAFYCDDVEKADTQHRHPSFSWGWQWRAAAGTAGDLPFWLHSNQLGALDRYSANTTLNLNAAYQHHFDFGLDLSTGANLLLRAAEDPVAWLETGYLQLGYGHFILWAGRKEEYFGLVHPSLSSGSMDLSRNARPMPKIVMATDGYQPLPGTRRVFYYQGTYAHGWMDDQDYRFVDNVLLHQKTLYLRMFTEDAIFVPRAGFTHFAHWGGDSPIFGRSPVDFRSYIDVIFSLKSDSKELLPGGQLSNVYQNHLGVYDFAAMFNIGRYKFGASRQFYLEDSPSTKFVAPWDGMWGAYIQRRPDSRTRWRREKTDDWQTVWERGNRPFLTGILYEHINTRKQIRRWRNERYQYANYYNHWAYHGGWTYHGRIIGNPLYYSEKGVYGVVNNKLIAHHFGLEGFAGPFAWRALTTYSRNYGAQFVYLIGDIPPDPQEYIPPHLRDSWNGDLKSLDANGNYTIQTEGSEMPLQEMRTLPVNSGMLYVNRDVPLVNSATPEDGIIDGTRISNFFGPLDQWSFLLEISTDQLARRDLRHGPPTRRSSRPAGESSQAVLSGVPVSYRPSFVKLSLALDLGQAHPDNFGVMITLGWQNRESR